MKNFSCIEDTSKIGGDRGIMISKFDLEHEIATILEKSLTY